MSVFAAGCAGEKGVISPPLTTEDPTHPVETGLDGGAVDAAFFAITGRFAYDPAIGRHTGFVESDGGPAPMEVSVLLIDTSAIYEGVSEENSCAVTLEVEEPQPSASWVESAGAWTGFDVPPTVSVRDRCKAYVLPGDFGGDAGSHIAKWQWGIGIGPVDPVIAEQLRTTLPASEWAALEDYILGAFGWSNLFIGSGVGSGDGLATQGYGTAFEVDGNFEISLSGTGNPLPIPSEDVAQPQGVARAYYEVTLGPFQSGTFLAQDPP